MGEGFKELKQEVGTTEGKPLTDRSCPGSWCDDRGLGAALERGRNVRGKWCFAYFRGESVEPISRKLGISRYPT